MSSRITRYATLFLFALIIGCDGYESPTAPTPPPAPTTAARIRLSMATNSSHTIRVARLTFDGTVVDTIEIAGGGGQVSFDKTVQTTAGAHVIGVVIAEQASTPNRYILSGSITLPAKILDLAPVQRDLATGEVIELRVTF